MISLVLEPADGGTLPDDPAGAVRLGVRRPARTGTASPASTPCPRRAFGTRLQITVRRVRGVERRAGRPGLLLPARQCQGRRRPRRQRPGGRFRRRRRRTARCCWPAPAPASPRCCRSSSTSPAPSRERTVIVAHADRTAQDHALRDTVLHVAGTSTTSPPTPGTRSVDPDDRRSGRGYMDLSQIAAARRRPGLHLRSAAVHAARPVDAARARRPAGEHPLRGVRAGPVGADAGARRDLIDRTVAGGAAAAAPPGSTRVTHRWAAAPHHRRCLHPHRAQHPKSNRRYGE